MQNLNESKNSNSNKELSELNEDFKKTEQLLEQKEAKHKGNLASKDRIIKKKIE